MIYVFWVVYGWKVEVKKRVYGVEMDIRELLYLYLNSLGGLYSIIQ